MPHEYESPLAPEARARAAPSAVASASSTRDSQPERIIVAYFTLLPLLWALGLLLPLAVLMVFGLLLRVRSRRAYWLAWPWFAVGICQLASSAVNVVAAGQPIIVVPRHALASYVLGWIMLGACIAIGASGTVRPAALLRATARVGFYCVGLAGVLYILAVAQGERYLHVLTPIGRLMPVTLPSTSFFFGMLLYNWEELFGVLLPRLSLLFPWTTAMGFGGLCLVWVTANQPDPRKRRWAMASGVFMVIASMSRLAALALALSAALRFALALSRPVQVLLAAFALVLGAAVGLVGTLAEGSPLAAVKMLSERFDNLRPSATQSRDRVYEQTRAGLAEAPLAGHGWPGEPVYPKDYPQVMQGDGTMVPGSHSSYLGLVYLGGVMTLAAFLFALLRTTWLVLRAAGPPALRLNTAVLLGVFAVTGIGEGLYSLVVPTLYAFLWLGAALRELTAGAPAPVPAALAPLRAWAPAT
ncbi:MAG: O-antigen ligase family protein [Candidatus Binatia bacterium]